MKSALNATIALSLFVFSHSAFAATDALQNCYETSSRAQFFTYELENIAKEGATPVLLFNAQQQVVGVISVSPGRDANGKATSVVVNNIELCSSLETDNFSYTDGIAGDLLTWIGAGKDAIEITQDEGLLVVNAQEFKKEEYATLVRVEYKAYDVFNDEETVNSPANRKKADHIEDWGLPKGKGEFFFYIPKNWSCETSLQ